MSESMLELKKHDIQKARKSLTTFYNDLKNVDHWEHKIYKSIFKYLAVLSTRLFYYDNATDVEIEKASKGNKKGKEMCRMVDQNKVSLMIAIVDRGWETMKGHYKDKLDMMVDVAVAHEDCPLKLQELLDADDGNFYHDIVGIHNNLNRETRKLENCFVPRYAK